MAAPYYNLCNGSAGCAATGFPLPCRTKIRFGYSKSALCRSWLAWCGLVVAALCFIPTIQLPLAKSCLVVRLPAWPHQPIVQPTSTQKMSNAQVTPSMDETPFPGIVRTPSNVLKAAGSNSAFHSALSQPGTASLPTFLVVACGTAATFAVIWMRCIRGAVPGLNNHHTYSMAATFGQRSRTSPSARQPVRTPGRIRRWRKSSVRKHPLEDSSVMICCMPPPPVWRHFQEFRCIYDRNFTFWPPHLRLMRPFWRDVDDNLEFAAKVMAKAFYEKPPMRLNLSTAVTAYPDHIASILLAPVSSGIFRAKEILCEALEKHIEWGTDRHRYHPTDPFLQMGTFQDETSRDYMLKQLQRVFSPIEWWSDELVILSQPDPSAPAIIRYRIKFSQETPDLIDEPYIATVGDDEGLTELLCIPAEDLQKQIFHRNLQRLRQPGHGPDPPRPEPTRAQRLLEKAYPDRNHFLLSEPFDAETKAQNAENEIPLPFRKLEFFTYPIPEDKNRDVIPIDVGLGVWPEGVWTFVYGEDLIHYSLQEEKGITPIRSVRAMLPGYSLAFNGVAGFANIEPLNDRTASDLHQHGIDGVYGIAHLLPVKDYAMYVDYQNCFKPMEMVVYPLDEKTPPFEAVVFQSLPDRHIKPWLPAPEDYLDMVVQGAEDWGLPDQYVQWLLQYPTIPSSHRGPEYWLKPDGNKIEFITQRGPQPEEMYQIEEVPIKRVLPDPSLGFIPQR